MDRSAPRPSEDADALSRAEEMEQWLPGLPLPETGGSPAYPEPVGRKRRVRPSRDWLPEIVDILRRAEDHIWLCGGSVAFSDPADLRRLACTIAAPQPAILTLVDGGFLIRDSEGKHLLLGYAGLTRLGQRRAP